MPGKSLRDVALGQLAGCEMGLTLESEEGEVPHLRWSQAPPLPWPRPGSVDIYILYTQRIYIYTHTHLNTCFLVTIGKVPPRIPATQLHPFSCHSGGQNVCCEVDEGMDEPTCLIRTQLQYHRDMLWLFQS